MSYLFLNVDLFEYVCCHHQSSVQQRQRDEIIAKYCVGLFYVHASGGIETRPTQPFRKEPL